MSHHDESPASAADANDAVLAAVNAAGEAGVRTVDLGGQTGRPQTEVGPASWRLVDEGRLRRKGDVVFAIKPIAEDVAPAQRRDAVHGELRAKKWERIREIDPLAGPGGTQIQTAIQRRAMRNDAVCPARVTITLSCDLDEDAEQIGRRVATELRELQAIERVDKRPNAGDAERLAELADHASKFGKGVDGWERWRQTHPDHPYSSRQAYHAAAAKALERRSSVASEMWRFAGRPAVERTMRPDGRVSTSF